jgi:glycosyltransferase involved in cell wall biosynthesis
VRIDRVARVRWLGPAIWARLLLGAAPRDGYVLEEMIGGARVPFFAPWWTRRPVVGFWYQDNRTIFQAQYGRLGTRFALAVQRRVLAAHRRCPVLCPSEASRDWLVGQGYPADRVGVCHPAVDEARLADPSRGFKDRRDLIVCIGNLRRLKRFEEAIEVLGRVRAQVPSAELAIVGRRGDERYREQLADRAQQSDVRGAVRFLLDLPEADKFRLLAEAKVLTVHSPIEGFGITIIEAGLCGVPCTANAGVPTVVVEDGVGGLRVPVGDVEAYVRATVRLLADGAEWTRLSEGARAGASRYRSPTMDDHGRRILDALAGAGPGTDPAVPARP